MRGASRRVGCRATDAQFTSPDSLGIHLMAAARGAGPGSPAPRRRPAAPAGGGLVGRNSSRKRWSSAAPRSGLPAPLAVSFPSWASRPTATKKSSVRSAGRVSQITRASSCDSFHIACTVPDGISSSSPAARVRSSVPTRARSVPKTTSKCSSWRGWECSSGSTEPGLVGRLHLQQLAVRVRRGAQEAQPHATGWVLDHIARGRHWRNGSDRPAQRAYGSIRPLRIA